MLYEAIDHVVFLASDVSAAVAPFERLGLTLAPAPYANLALPSGPAVGTRAFYLGREHNLFFIHFLTAPVPRPGLAVVALRVAQLGGAVRELARHGVPSRSLELRDAEGTKIADAALLGEKERAGADLLLIQYTRPQVERYTALRDAGQLRHALPLRRLDHLASVAPNLEARSRFWDRSLDLPSTGEINTPQMLIRQHPIGDAVMELLGPAGPDSPLHQREPGLVSLISLEVSGLDTTVEEVRRRGFHPTEPAPGPLPATRIATLDADELGGLKLQLLERLDSRGPDPFARPGLA